MARAAECSKVAKGAAACSRAARELQTAAKWQTRCRADAVRRTKIAASRSEPTSDEGCAEVDMPTLGHTPVRGLKPAAPVLLGRESGMVEA